jgi:hypothetical protein
MNASTWLVNAALAALFALAGIAAARRLQRRHPDLTVETTLKRSPYLWVLIPLNLLLLVAGVTLMLLQRRHPSALWALPVWFEYHLLIGTWGSILSLFAFVFSLGAAVAMRTRHRERTKFVVAAALLVAAIQTVEWNYARPVAPILRDDISAAGMVTQTSDVSCAAASGATLARLLGMAKTEREMAEFYGTSALLGTTAAQVIYGNATIGIASRKVEVPDRDPERVAAPAMFFVDHPATGPESHAVAYLGMKEGKAEVWDPIRGLKRLDRKSLASVWRGRGIEFRLASAR